MDQDIMGLPGSDDHKVISRKDFLKGSILIMAGTFIGSSLLKSVSAQSSADGTPDEPYDWNLHRWGMLITVGKCIGCGRCANACKEENNVSREPFYFRTWIERYIVKKDGETLVDSPNGGIDGFPSPPVGQEEVDKSFYVPKICNHCAEPPCVQVCPVGATYITRDGAVLVDRKYCIGCRYCIQACPYGMRYLNPRTKTADKCTFCYHRITKGLKTACAEVCPTGARLFGDLKDKSSELSQFIAKNRVMVLKPALNTRPKVYYPDLDEEVN